MEEEEVVEVKKVEEVEEEAEEVERNAYPPPWRHMHDNKCCNSM